MCTHGRPQKTSDAPIVSGLGSGCLAPSENSKHDSIAFLILAFRNQHFNLEEGRLQNTGEEKYAPGYLLPLASLESCRKIARQSTPDGWGIYGQNISLLPTNNHQ